MHVQPCTNQCFFFLFFLKSIVGYSSVNLGLFICDDNLNAGYEAECNEENVRILNRGYVAIERFSFYIILAKQNKP